jgi:hypothetical protein
MASSSAYTYDDGANKEDLLDILINLDPVNTQLVSGLGTSSAKGIRHETLIKTLGTVKTNAYAEGADASYQNQTDPTRLVNYTQIFREPYRVTDTERAVDTAGFEDRFSQEATDAMSELKNDMELAVLRGSLASGTGSAARQLGGIKNCLSLVTSQSGVSLTEVQLNDYLQLVWDNTNTQVNAVYGSMYIKRKISGFTAGNTKNVNADDKRLVQAVDVYQADAAQNVKLFAHRYMKISGDTNYDILGLDENLFKVAFLRKPFTRELAKVGDDTRGEVVTEATLECRHYNAGFLAKLQL